MYDSSSYALFQKKQANLQLNAVLIIRLDQDIAYLWKLFVRRDHLMCFYTIREVLQ